MKRNGLSDKQFITIALIIVICGIAIIGHDYFLAKKSAAFENMSILLSQDPDVVTSEDENTTIRQSEDENESEGRNTAADPSGKVKKKNVTYNYAGRIKIPKIGVNRGFLKYGTVGNNVDQNVAVMRGSTYPNTKNSNLVLAAHSGTGWNAYFDNLNKLKKGDYAYVTYGNKQYKYKATKKYKDKKNDGEIKIYYYNDKKHLTLVTCSKPDYKSYYLVVTFDLVKEEAI